MPRLSVLMIRTALIWLAFGYSVGALVLANKGVPFASWLWTLRASHIHSLLFGWTVQLTFGVAFWIMPRLDKDGSRGNERLVWLSYSLLNAGVLAACVREPFAAFVPLSLNWLSLFAAICYAISAVCFALHGLPRLIPSIKS